jgi:predicted ATPase/DNA-binding SARP family transcriptional activator/tetratricopeptide (TPR) repeat protein
VEVRVLGAVELVDGGSVVRLAPTERALLAALAARVGERVAVETLEDALWPAARPPSARKSLQGHVARLRRSLGAESIAERSGGYRLDPDHIDVDAVLVGALLTEARAAIGAGRPADAMAVLEGAKSSFRGDPYADVPEAALPAGEVHRLQELQAAVVEEGFEAALATGEGDRCLGELEAWLERNPFREQAWGQLMRALYQAGRSADALGAYGRARVVFATELGLEPGPALRELERSILTHDPRLRGPLAAEALGPANAPAALSPLIGRASELAALDELFQDHRLVTLTGTGGIGKTRLATEMAARLAGRHQFGPYFVDLVPVADPDLVPSALAATLAVEVDAHADVMERVRSALDGHDVVLVMDNCEHLLPGVAGLVAGLLAGSSGVRVLATSREPLDVAGERVWPVSPLDVPADSASLEEIEHSASGALFIARLPMNVTARSLSPDDVTAVGAVCRGLDGIPLGLELAAARSRTLSLTDLADRLEQSITELALPGHGVVPRHRTMHAALDWGMKFLSPPAQSALRAMSVFGGGCEFDAFVAVCVDDGDPPAVGTMDELVRTSFVTVDFAAQPPRYRLLEPVRQFAAELLDAAGERDERQGRHLHHYVEVAHTLHGHSTEPTQPIPLEPLQCELGNFRVALDWAAGSSDRTDAGLRLAAYLYYVWTTGNHQAEGVARAVGLLRTGSGSADARSHAARVAAVVAADLGDDDLTLALSEQSLQAALDGATDPVYEGRARQLLAHVYGERGDIPAARRQLDAAMQLRTERADEGLREFCLVSKALVDAMTADLTGAAAAAEEVVKSRFGNTEWIGPTARAVLGGIMVERGDLDRARSWVTEALALCESLGDTRDAIVIRLVLVSIECYAGRLDEAEAHFNAAVDLSPLSDRGTDVGLLLGRADLALAVGDPTRAAELAEAALARANEMSWAHGRCRCLRLLGDAQLAAGKPDQALSTFQMLVARAGAAPYPCRLAEGHEGAAGAADALGHAHAAHRHLGAAAEIRQRTGTRRVGRPAVEEHLRKLEGQHGLQVSESGR